MGERKNYNTKQQKAILEYIMTQKNNYVTINQISDYMKEKDIAIGLTTIYRAMERLEKQGYVHKIQIDGVTGSCFQYSPSNEEGSTQFYLKCEKCGEITNLDCSHLSKLYDHVQMEHDFHINPHKTMFYGVCSGCKKKQ